MEYRNRKQEEVIAKYLEDGSNEQYIKEWSYSMAYKRDGDRDEDAQVADSSELLRKFSQLCTELKFLYVAITRPKNRLFIYDEVA